MLCLVFPVVPHQLFFYFSLFYFVFKHISNHTKYLQLNLIHSFVYIVKRSCPLSLVTMWQATIEITC